jgi:hypothetical protein
VVLDEATNLLPDLLREVEFCVEHRFPGLVDRLTPGVFSRGKVAADRRVRKILVVDSHSSLHQGPQYPVA